jgi:hypothetical protein
MRPSLLITVSLIVVAATAGTLPTRRRDEADAAHGDRYMRRALREHSLHEPLVSMWSRDRPCSWDFNDQVVVTDRYIRLADSSRSDIFTNDGATFYSRRDRIDTSAYAALLEDSRPILLNHSFTVHIGLRVIPSREAEAAMSAISGGSDFLPHLTFELISLDAVRSTSADQRVPSVSVELGSQPVKLGAFSYLRLSGGVTSDSHTSRFNYVSSASDNGIVLVVHFDAGKKLVSAAVARHDSRYFVDCGVVDIGVDVSLAHKMRLRTDGRYPVTIDVSFVHVVGDYGDAENTAVPQDGWSHAADRTERDRWRPQTLDEQRAAYFEERRRLQEEADLNRRDELGPHDD